MNSEELKLWEDIIKSALSGMKLSPLFDYIDAEFAARSAIRIADDVIKQRKERLSNG